MRVAVTGASGFIGSSLCRSLANDGHEPIAVVRASSRLDRLEGAGSEAVVAALGHQGSLVKAFAGADAVVHCAALVDPYANPWEARSTNFIAAFNVCHAASDAGVEHIVQMSTAAVYSRSNRRGMPLQEDHATIIEDPPVYDTYSINKAAAERVVMDFGRGGRIQASVIRPGAVYGTGDRFSGPLAAAIKANRMCVIGSRELRLPLIHIDDLVSAVTRLLSHPPHAARAFNVDGPTPTTFGAYLDALAATLDLAAELRTVPIAAARAAAWASETWWNIGKRDGPAPLNRFAVELIAADFVLDTSRIRTELGWSPTVRLDDGVRSLRSWLQSEELPAAALPIPA